MSCRCTRDFVRLSAICHSRQHRFLRALSAARAMEEGLASSSSSEDDADEPPPRAEEILPPLFHEAAGPPPEEETPITERPNPATDFIDAQATTADLARLLTQCDREMYGMPTGDVLGHAGLGSAHFARMFGQLTDQIVEYVRLNQQGATIEATTPGKWRPRAVVFIVGCGTSGRRAFQASRAGNAALKARGHAPMFRHVVAGGDAALFQCVESAEDDGARARDDYDAALAAAGGDAITDAFMIGISAGLSARYVAEMLNRAFDDPKHRFAVAFLGFNPSNQARERAMFHPPSPRFQRRVDRAPFQYCTVTDRCPFLARIGCCARIRRRCSPASPPSTRRTG
jgi:hypothetical protein